MSCPSSFLPFLLFPSPQTQGRGPAVLPLDRIVVEPNGDMFVLEPSVICDACPSCDDICSLENCRGCNEKREWLGFPSPEEHDLTGMGDDGSSSNVGYKTALGSQVSSCLPGGKMRGSNFTLCEIRRHRTLASCWLVAKGQVYDATPYLSKHPAGAIAIARKAGGRDCSEDLEFHSSRAQKLWKHLRIGTVRPCPSQRSGGEAHFDQEYGRSGSMVGTTVGPSCAIM